MLKVKPLVEQLRENKKGRLRKYYVIYLLAFGGIALIAFVSQLLVQSYLGKQSEDSHLINVSGKQRMLSQRITKNFMIYQLDKNVYALKKASEDLKLWSETHYLLKNDELIASKNNTSETDLLYKKLTPSFEDLYKASQSFLVDQKQVYLQQVLFHEKRYLPIMDELVNHYDTNYQQKLKFLRRVELGLSIFLVFMLAVEMFFVFLPLINRLQRTFLNLVKAERDASRLADNLNDVNLKLNKSNKALNDVNLALDRASLVMRTDVHGQIIYTNESYCSLTKYTEDELLGKPLFYNNSGGQESIIYNHIRDREKKYDVWQGEVRDTASDNTEFWLDVTLFPIINANDELYEYFVICSDVTKRKETEKELEVVNEQRFQKQVQVQELNSRSIIEGQERERKRMAVEVHDGLGQMLTALKFTCEALEPTDDSQENIKQNMKSLLQDVIKETRRISSDLLPAVLNDFGLIAGLKELVNVVGKTGEVNISLVNESLLNKRLPKEQEIALYRITQEAINNAMKHASASTLLIKITTDPEFFNIFIADDGSGIKELPELLTVTGMNKGNGLRNMRERAKLIGSTFYINSRGEKGTEIFIETPLRNED